MDTDQHASSEVRRSRRVARRRRWAVMPALALALALVAAACGSSTSSTTTTAGGQSTTTAAGGETTTTAPRTQFSVLTYNAGLAVGFVDLAEERAKALPGALAELTDDVVILQEVWRPQDVEAVTAALSGWNTVFPPPQPEVAATAACTPEQVAPLEACVRDKCSAVPGDQLVSCGLSNCATEVNALTASAPTCFACLAAGVGATTIDEFVTTCSKPAETYAYGGSFGVGIATRDEILASDVLVLPSTTNRRAVVYAKVASPAFGPVHVFGTHLSAVFNDIPYPGTNGTSWEEEQARQVDQMLSWIQAKTEGDTAPIVLAGDLNTGPAGTGFGPEAPANYERLAAAGWDHTWIGSPRVVCTFCADNALVGGADDNVSVSIDHVLVRRFPGTVDFSRVLDAPVQITGANGTVVATPLSDHYGVRAVLLP